MAFKKLSSLTITNQEYKTSIRKISQCMTKRTPLIRKCRVAGAFLKWTLTRVLLVQKPKDSETQALTQLLKCQLILRANSQTRPIWEHETVRGTVNKPKSSLNREELNLCKTWKFTIIINHPTKTLSRSKVKAMLQTHQPHNQSRVTIRLRFRSKFSNYKNSSK